MEKRERLSPGVMKDQVKPRVIPHKVVQQFNEESDFESGHCC
ncbi:hypothetical protein JCM19235_5107 [Vibrio maritimus]|uniref:Uncharacterized protein n=1 Tax=Vibrio maritimus TaxID=990268 RepID=A0A090RPV0_9VIBR|nr:hypothetical protein JCM19235_5107 [Vibrio maritimus]